tara:strand:- start:1812 stop:2096 length:285 start_codon:yes stop_codon:yes gene_type:complete
MMFSENQLYSNKQLADTKKSLLIKWNELDDSKKELAKKIWSVITYKWRWQIAMNAPFMLIWLLDRSIPAVHKFDMRLIASLPIPQWLSMFMGLN